MATITPTSTNAKALSSIKLSSVKPPAKQQYTDSLAKLSLSGNPAGLPAAKDMTRLRPESIPAATSNGATSPAQTKIVPPTTQAAANGGGAYQGPQTGGSLSSPAAQTYISSQLGANGQPGSTQPTEFGATPPSTGSTPAAPAKPEQTTYDLAMKSYLDSLKSSQDINAKVQKETLAGNRAYQADLDRSGGYQQGNQSSAALTARRSNASLADLGVAETSATNAANLAFQRMQYEKGILPEPADPYTLSPGQTRFDPAGNVISALPDTKSVPENQNPDRVLTATEAQSLGVPFGTTAGSAYGITPEKPLTEAQAKDVTYGQRGQEANSILNSLESAIANFNPVTYASYKALENTAVGNSIVPDEIKQIRQAQRNFATAILRRESGAAISPSEFETVEKQYFPRPGDDAKTLQQKKQNRDTAINSFLANIPQGQGGGDGGGSIWDF